MTVDPAFNFEGEAMVTDVKTSNSDVKEDDKVMVEGKIQKSFQEILYKLEGLQLFIRYLDCRDFGTVDANLAASWPEQARR